MEGDQDDEVKSRGATIKPTHPTAYALGAATRPTQGGLRCVASRQLAVDSIAVVIRRDNSQKHKV
jgi:hypothetical protein